MHVNESGDWSGWQPRLMTWPWSGCRHRELLANRCATRRRAGGHALKSLGCVNGGGSVGNCIDRVHVTGIGRCTTREALSLNWGRHNGSASALKRAGADDGGERDFRLMLSQAQSPLTDSSAVAAPRLDRHRSRRSLAV